MNERRVLKEHTVEVVRVGFLEETLIIKLI